METQRPSAQPPQPAPEGTGTRVWIRILQFLVAVLIMAFLAVGPQVWDAFGKLLDYLNRARAAPPNTVTTPIEPAATPATIRVSAPQSAKIDRSRVMAAATTEMLPRALRRILTFRDWRS